jgi:16S rRNA (guanine527-N7)-methyltransferase
MGDFASLKQPDWLHVSRETIEALEEFANLVLQWTARINLISPSTTPDIWDRHILDSAQLFDFATPGASWVDLGTGGGFPGIVLAILAREKDPKRSFQFVEADQRKTAFLRKAALQLSLPVKCHATRTEAIEPLSADTLTARALAPLVDLLSMVDRHLAPGGRAILPKGAKALDEIDIARKLWSFDLTIEPSRTDPHAQILLIENLSHA